jgi:hypothetical protein
MYTDDIRCPVEGLNAVKVATYKHLDIRHSTLSLTPL